MDSGEEDGGGGGDAGEHATQVRVVARARKESVQRLRRARGG